MLLEELGADYELNVLNLRQGQQRQAVYLRVNPMGKAPVGLHDGALVTEQGAVHAYLADLSPEAGITPAIGDALRGAVPARLAAGPWLLGERFTAADVPWGTALRWTTMFKLVPETPVIAAYVARVAARPAVARAAKIDADLLAKQAAG